MRAGAPWGVPCTGAAGFTLVELVIVLVILAVAGSLAIPRIQPALESVRAEREVRDIASWLEKVRLRAVLERKVLQVRCDAAAGALELVGSEEGGEPFPTPENVTLVSCDPEEASYHPQGSAEQLTILLRDRSGRERRVTVGAFTGLARIGDWQ